MPPSREHTSNNILNNVPVIADPDLDADVGKSTIHMPLPSPSIKPLVNQCNIFFQIYL